MRLKSSSALFDKTRRRKSSQQFKRTASRRSSRLGLEQLEARNLLATVTFQQGLGDYAGQVDTVLYSREPDVNAGTEGSISPDQQDANGVRQGLLKFEDIIGNMPGQIPLGATINNATLTVNVINDSNSAMLMSLYRMQQDWGESTATWNSFGAIPGVQASEGESSDLPPDSILFESDTSANTPSAGIFDVKRTLEYWAAGVPNYGWLIESAATNGWDFTTKESPQVERPKLVVEFDMPASAADFQILNTSVIQAEGNLADMQPRKAIIEVARLGDISGAASINYTVTADTATAGDDFVEVATPQTLNFAANQGLATIEVTIIGDDDLEGFETVLVTLSGGTTVSGRGVATVTIADDDALINEVLANVTNADDETNREYVELIGTPGASLNGYYFVVFEGEEEGDAGTAVGGAAAGVADLVIDLAGQTFGANGLLVITGNNWEYQGLKDADTNQMIVAAFDAGGGVLEDSSQTYALIRSPNNPMVQGTDYDTVGAYEDATNQAIGVGVGVLDSLPAGAALIDSVFVVEGGGGDRDRAATTELLGYPGIHVHQPTAFIGSNVTSDAVSRRFGQTLPNSIGAWFNGDISNGDISTGPIRYLENTFFISVVSPDGAVLTPGSENILRSIFFRVADQEAEVEEATGSVTLRIERTGDVANEQIDVTYRSVDIGSATEDADYTGVEQTVTFMPGEAFKDVTITVLPDDDAEGFERFRVDIVSVSDPSYLITNGVSSIGTGPGEPAVINGQAVVTIIDANVLTKTFQNGVDGYSGTTDAYLDGEFIDLKFGQDPVVRVDQVKGEGEQAAAVVRPQQGLLRFDDIIGDAMNQVPMGSTIFDAFLTLNVTNVASGADIRFFRMLQDWDQVNATWIDPRGDGSFSILNGVTPDNIEATAVPDARVPSALTGQAGLVQIPLNVDTFQSWANGSLDNFGWSIVTDAGSLWSFNSSEAFLTGTFKPELTILYTEPEAESAGTFSFAVDDYTVGESGGMATITLNRIGGSMGAATVDWNVTPGTGDAGDIGTASGSVMFAQGELFKTFDISIVNDNELERNETFILTLSGTGLNFDRSEAVLTIRDNDFVPSSGDLLLNELWINSPGNDPPHEFVELIGEAGIGMGSLYYVAIEGLVGDREGTAEKVVNIGSYLNGSNGFSLLTPDAADFAFRVPDGTTQIDRLGSIGTENVASQNDSTTYMLLYSPLTVLTETPFDYDWDNDGALELPVNVQRVDSVGVRVAGAVDQIYGPGTNEVTFNLTDPDVDAIARIRGNTERDRGSAWYGGDLFPAGDDYLLYEAAEAFFLPVAGTAMTPGEANTGTAVQSPLVSLVNVAAGVEAGSITAMFTAPVSQLVAGDGGPAGPGGAGITITDTNGVEIPTVDIRPTVTGLGTDMLTITFSGSGVVGGQLPTGSYRLNFVGNALIANGRAVDAANTATPAGSDRQMLFNVVAATGDYNRNGVVDTADYVLWRKQNGTNVTAGTGADGSGDGMVDETDYNLWRANFGNAGSVVFPGAAGGSSLPLAASLSVASQPLSEKEVSAVESSVSSATADSVFVEWPRTTFSFPVRGRGAALAARGIAASATKLSENLLLSLRRGDKCSGQEQDAGNARSQRHRDQLSQIDNFFATLGEQSVGSSLAS